MCATRGFLRPGSLDDYLIFRLHGVTRPAIVGIDARLRRELGISRRDWRALAFLARHEALPAMAFARAAGLDKVIASRLVANLVERGLVVRRREPADGRIALLSLSARGRELYEEALVLTAAYNESLARVLDEDEARLLEGVLARLTERAQALLAEERALGGAGADAPAMPDPAYPWRRD